MNGAFRTVFREMTAPLLWYYLVSLAVPIANGAAQRGRAFAQHALVVLIVPPLLVVLGWATWQIAASVCRLVRLESGTFGPHDGQAKVGDRLFFLRE